MTAQIDEVPDKLFYKVGEVCQYTDTQPYVLRFWESEFPQLAPEKNRSGQRVYRRQDVDLIFRIKKLLYEEEYTIAGARRRLEQEITGEIAADEPSDRAPAAAHPVADSLPPASRTREARRLPLDELLPDDPVAERPVAPAGSAAGEAAGPAAGHAAELPTAGPSPAGGAVDVLRREVHDLRAALARAEKSLGETEDSRLAAERGRLAADEARRTAEDQRDALRAKLRRAAARVEQALERLGPEDATR